MPTTREVDAARAERRRRQAEAPPPAPAARTQLDRRLERIAQHHAHATAPARWICRVADCPLAGVEHPAPSRAEALRLADEHYDTRHAQPPPEDLEELRAAWVAAGRPNLGDTLDAARPSAYH